jgi:hypothetical protein
MVVRHRKDLGARKHERVQYRKPGFIIAAPEAPWIECFILDVSQSGICLEVGALAVPQIFAISFTSCGTVKRLCRSAWRRGELIGARYVTAKQLRQSGKEETLV